MNRLDICKMTTSVFAAEMMCMAPAMPCFEQVTGVCDADRWHEPSVRKGGQETGPCDLPRPMRAGPMRNTRYQ